MRPSKATLAITQDLSFVERIRTSEVGPLEAGGAEAASHMAAELTLLNKVSR